MNKHQNDWVNGIETVVNNWAYGNHSCADCLSNPFCPISNRSNNPNSCSNYWPPNAPSTEPSEAYWHALQEIADYRVKTGRDPRGWK